MTPDQFQVALEAGAVTALHYPASAPAAGATLILAHGAGADFFLDEERPELLSDQHGGLRVRGRGGGLVIVPGGGQGWQRAELRGKGAGWAFK